jgi:hypothetical protein
LPPAGPTPLAPAEVVSTPPQTIALTDAQVQKVARIKAMETLKRLGVEFTSKMRTDTLVKMAHDAEHPSDPACPADTMQPPAEAPAATVYQPAEVKAVLHDLADKCGTDTPKEVIAKFGMGVGKFVELKGHAREQEAYAAIVAECQRRIAEVEAPKETPKDDF